MKLREQQIRLTHGMVDLRDGCMPEIYRSQKWCEAMYQRMYVAADIVRPYSKGLALFCLGFLHCGIGGGQLGVTYQQSLLLCKHSSLSTSCHQQTSPITPTSLLGATASKSAKMLLCKRECDSRYCVSDPQTHEAMAKHPELVERYANESQQIRNAIKTLVHADASFTQLHWVEILPLMKKFGNDIALMHHTSFRHLAAPAEILDNVLTSFDRGIWCLEQIVWVPGSARCQEHREWTVQLPPHLARFIGSQQVTSHCPTHSQNLQPQIPAPQAQTLAPQVNIRFHNMKLPPRQMERSSPEMQPSPCVSPPLAAGNTHVGDQLSLAETAAYVSASESKSISSSRRRREPDACSPCKLKKTGCGGRFKHCLKSPAKIKSPTATSIRKSGPHVQLNRRAASFPVSAMTRPAFNKKLSGQMSSSGRQPSNVEGPYTTEFEGETPFDNRAPLAMGAAFGSQHAHTFPTTTPTDAQDGIDIFATLPPFGMEWFDEIGYRTDDPLDREHDDILSGSY